MSRIVLVGIDPGSLVTGYGAIMIENRSFTALEYGCIKTKKSDPMSKKLSHIYSDIQTVLSQYKPEEVVVENVFYSKNVRSSMVLGHVRGVLLLAGEKSLSHVVELTPREIKKFVTGSGSASKEKVNFMVCKILELREPPKQEDAADALAAALAHGLSITKG